MKNIITVLATGTTTATTTTNKAGIMDMVIMEGIN